MSDSSSSPSLDELFEAAAVLPRDQRAAYLRQACDDEALRRQVELLLAADDAAGGDDFLGSALLGKSILPDAVPSAADESPTSEVNPPGGPVRENNQSDGSRFRILGKHRQGGLGEVLVALDRQLNREVAIKQVRSRWRGHAEARQRFIQEAEITGRLEHPGVVPVYAMGTWDDGRDYYAMRFIEGQTLRDAIDEFHADQREQQFNLGPITPQAVKERSRDLRLRQLLHHFIDVCNTIEYAHSRRVLHRDIKPSNIMLGPYGETLVVDWGLAKLLDTPTESSMTMQFLKASCEDASDSSPTIIGGAVGTPQYMSPEQAAGDIEAIGIPTDLWLLGATLYHLLTGRPPHSESSLTELIASARAGVRERPRDVDPEVPAALEAICLKAMATYQRERYPSAAALAADVERWIADEPVMVYQDPLAVRAARWLRRHRAAAYSLAVAGLLIVIGSILGSLVYSGQRVKQLAVERERNETELELRAQRQQRFIELQSSLVAAEQFAGEEIRVGRFPSALGFVNAALESIAQEPSLQDARVQLAGRQEPLQRLVDFYQIADRAQRENILSRDTQAIMACRAALDAVGVWDHPDWWSHLPDPGLSPQQLDQLRWDVYQQLSTFDGLLVKRMAAQLAGDDWRGGEIPFWTLMRAVFSSAAGRPEASSAIVVSDRIHAFRLSESARWYRAAAAFRLGQGKRLQGHELGPPRNATDAQGLGLLCLVASQDAGFESFFDGYQGDDPLAAARDLFLRSATLRSDHYPAQLSLGLTEFLVLQREIARAVPAERPNWQAYRPILKTFGSCISIGPHECFAFADRASIYRFQAQAIHHDTSLSEEQRHELAVERLRWSLADAEVASQLGRDQPWVDWHYGLSLFAVGQTEQALERLLRASRLSLPLGETQDALLLRVDDLRGRTEVVDLVQQLLVENPQDAEAYQLLASVRLNQNQLEEARIAADRAIELDEELAHAHAVRGMTHFRSGEASLSRSNLALTAGKPDRVRSELTEATRHFRSAESDLDACLRRQPDHGWACYAKAACEEIAGNLAAALSGYRQAAAVAGTDEHRAAALLGQARMLAVAEKFGPAREAVDAARSLAPACDVMTVVFPLARRIAMPDLGPNPSPVNLEPLAPPDSTAEPTSITDLKTFIRSLSDLPRPSTIRRSTIPANPETLDPLPTRAALLDGGFELKLGRYWSDESGAIWANHGGYDSRAETTSEVAYRGTSSLYVRGRPSDPERFRYASMGQSFPVAHGEIYELRFWAKADALAADAVRFETGHGRVLATVPPGSFDWTEVRGRFQADAMPLEGAGPFGEMRLKLVSAGPGKAWIDEVEIVRVRPEPAPESASDEI